MGETPRRLRRRQEFLTVAKSGRKVAVPGLVLQAMERPAEAENSLGSKSDDTVRIGFTVTRKVGNAVVRNRTRRRLRAAAEQVIPDHGIPGYDLVLIGRAGTAKRPFPALVHDLETAMRKLDAWQPAGATSETPE